MRTLGITLLATLLCACAKDPPESPMVTQADTKNRPSRRPAQQEADGGVGKGNAEPDGEGAEPEGALGDSLEDPSGDDSAGDDSAGDDSAGDDSAGDDSAGDDAPSSGSSDAEPVPLSAEPEDEEDTVDFGGGSTDVVVEPSAEPTQAPEPGMDDMVEPEGDDPMEEPDVAEDVEDPLVSCDGVAATGDGVLIDDFEDTNLEILVQDQREASWFYYDDGSGGEHTLLIDPTSREDDASVYSLHAFGGGFSEWGAGFGVGLRWQDTDGQRCVYDASYYTGLRFWLLGDGATLRVQGMNPIVIPDEDGGACVDDDTCWDNHGFDVTSSDTWTEVFIPFASLTQRWTEPPLPFDPALIATIEFTFDAYTDYDIWIDDLGFYRDGEEGLPDYGESLQTTE